MRLSIIITFFFTNFVFGQLSNKHWLPPLHSRDAGVVNDHYIYLSTPNPTPFSVSIKTGNGNPIQGSPFIISQGNPQTVLIGTSQPSSMFVSQQRLNIPIDSEGLILEATKDFYVTLRVRSEFHAEILVSKGIPGIGTNFRLGSLPQTSGGGLRNFVSSFMATEDNTIVTVSDYDTEVIFASGSGNITLDSQTFSLNKGQSVVLSGYTDTGNPSNILGSNLSGFVGALVTSNKPIAVSTGNALAGMLSQNQGQDFNLDQIVSAEGVGTEYIAVRGNGSDNSELPLVIATQDNTQIFINGEPSAYVTINAGEYALIPTTFYQGVSATNKNMYITSDKPIYLYQILAGTNSDATTGFNFIPPLSCFFQKSVDLIPSISSIGNFSYNTDIIALTHTSSVVSVNGIPTTSIPEVVMGTIEWVTYRIPSFTGNVVVESTGPLAVGVFGSSGAAGFSGYYSGFGSEPRDTDVTVCSNAPVNLVDKIDGNPEPNGHWNPLLNSGGDIFDPSIDAEGVYVYSYDGDCIPVLVTVNVTIQTAPNAGTNNTLVICSNGSSVDLFPLLGSNVTSGGYWQPTMASGSSLYNPNVDPGGVYSYTIEGNGICDDISASITITKNPTPIINTISEYKICDNTIDGDDTNGFVTFNLPSKTVEVLGGQTGVTVSYHASLQNAIDNVLPLTNYYSNTQLVYVRLINNTTNCFTTTSFDLVVNPLPIVNNVVTLKQCDTDTDAITDFNLTFANLLISSDTTLSYSYFTSQINAQNNLSPIANFINYTSANNGSVWSRVVNENGCFRVVKIDLLVSTTNPVSIPPIEECDIFIDSNDPSNDGFHYFNLNNATTSILAQFPSNQSLQVSYYTNEADALSGLNTINTSTDFRNTVPNNQFIWVRIDSSVNNECFGLGPYVQLIVNPIPDVELGSDFLVCKDANTGVGSQTINATPATIGNYSYNWTPSNPSTDSLGNQSAIYSVTQSGIYSVEVTNIDTSCKNTDSVTATFSSEPKSVSAILITPLFSPGSASIEAIPVGGFGVYEYSIDGGVEWQNSPIFTGLPNGSYVILVRDIAQCGIIETQSIQTVTYPAYFTPNGDGFNETWNINGLISSFKARIYIFDRYGKLLKQLSSNGDGWDGKFNGQPLPSTDYWFKIEYTEDLQLKEFKSHFTLKR